MNHLFPLIRLRTHAKTWTLLSVIASVSPAIAAPETPATPPPLAPEPLNTAPAGPLDVTPPATSTEGDNSLPAPTTAAGQVAPPLRVPPPPTLLPQPIPGLPDGVPSLAPAPLSLDDAVNLGLQNQISLDLARQNVISAAARVQQVKAGLKPSVVASAGLNGSNRLISRNTNSNFATGTGTGTTTGTTIITNNNGNFSNTYSAGLTARQLIYDFGGARASLNSARAQQDAAQLSTQTARESAILNIKQAYFNLLGAQGLIAANAQVVASQRLQLAQAQARYSAGTVSQSDVVTAQTNLAQTLLTLANAQSNEVLARVSLNLALGIDARTPTQVTDTQAATAPVSALNDLVEQTLDARPDILQSQAVVRSNEFNVESARTGNKPVISASATLGYNAGSQTNRNANLGVGVAASWDVFDSGLTKGQVAQAESGLQSAQLQLTQTQRTAVADVTQAYLNVANARQRVITSGAQVANAQEAVRLAQGRYASELAIYLEVTTAQASLSSALFDQVNAVYGLNIALANLDFAVRGGHAGGGNSTSIGSASNVVANSNSAALSTSGSSLNSSGASGSTITGVTP